MRSTGRPSLWVAGAKDGLARLGDKHINIALRHTSAVPEGQPRPTSKLARVLALMKWAVKCWTDTDCAAVLRRLVGLSGPKHRPSLLLQGNILEKCEGGCLARDDFGDAKKYRDDEQIRAVGVKMGGLKWMKEKGFISDEEYDNSMKHIMERKKHKASGDPHPGSSPGAAAAVEVPALAPRPKIDKEDEAWVRANALPSVLGCTITHDRDANKQRWYAKHPNCHSKSRNYGDKGTKCSRTSLECLNHVLHWTWCQHTRETGEPCPWDFTPRCD